MPLLKRVNFNEILTFDRNTDKTGFVLQSDGFGNQVPTLKTFAPNEPAKVIVDPLTKERLGISIHGQRTNFVRNSGNFTAATWELAEGGAGSLPTITANQGSLYGLDAAEIQFNVDGDSESDFSDLRSPGAVPVPVGGAQATVFLIIKSLNGTQQIRTNLAAAASPPLTITEKPIIISHTFTLSASGNYTFVLRQDGNMIRTDGRFLIAHVQAEIGAFATPPIITSGTAVTRLADNCRIEDIDQSDWWNPNEFTFIIEFESPRDTTWGAVSPFYIFGVIDTGNRSLTISADSTNAISALIRSNVEGFEIPNTFVRATSNRQIRNKVAISFSVADGKIAISANGGSTVTSNYPATSLAALATNFRVMDIAWLMNGNVAKILYEPRAMTAEELQSASQLGA